MKTFVGVVLCVVLFASSYAAQMKCQKEMLYVIFSYKSDPSLWDLGVMKDETCLYFLWSYKQKYCILCV